MDIIKKILNTFFLTSGKCTKMKQLDGKINIAHSERLEGVDERLIQIAQEVSKIMPIVVLPDGGVRTKERQKKLVEKGFSKTMNSKHLIGKALDIAPYYNNKVDWNAIPDFSFLCGCICIIANNLNIDIRQGCKWDKQSIEKNGFRDYPHTELK